MITVLSTSEMLNLQLVIFMPMVTLNQLFLIAKLYAILGILSVSLLITILLQKLIHVHMLVKMELSPTKDAIFMKVKLIGKNQTMMMTDIKLLKNVIHLVGNLKMDTNVGMKMFISQLMMVNFPMLIVKLNVLLIILKIIMVIYYVEELKSPQMHVFLPKDVLVSFQIQREICITNLPV